MSTEEIECACDEGAGDFNAGKRDNPYDAGMRRWAWDLGQREGDYTERDRRDTMARQEAAILANAPLERRRGFFGGRA